MVSTFLKFYLFCLQSNLPVSVNFLNATGKKKKKPSAMVGEREKKKLKGENDTKQQRIT